MTTLLRRPDWLQDPANRKIWIRRLAEEGVSRSILRKACGMTNNQMAGAANRAGVVFTQYTPTTIAKMRAALKKAGFSDVVIAYAVSEQPQVEDKIRAPRKSSGLPQNAPIQKGDTKEVLEKSVSLTKESDSLEHETPVSFELTPEDVRKNAAREMVAAARAIERQGSMSAPSPTKQPMIRSKVVLSNNDKSICQWPKSSGGSVKIPAICAAPAVDGLCEEHRAFARKHRRL